MYKKIRYLNTDVHVFEFNPKEYNSQITRGIVGKYEKLSNIDHSWYLNNGYEPICKINFGYFGQGIEHYGWLAYDSGFMQGNPENVAGIECYLTTDKKFVVEELTYNQAKTLVNENKIHWGGSTSFPLVIEGKKFTEWQNYSHYSHHENDNPRTAIGQRKDGIMILAVVDGRSKYDAGLTGEELAEFMLLLGCYYATNVDGGGSSEMIVKTDKGQTIVNSPSDGTERLIGSSLQVFAKKIDNLIIDTSTYITLEEYLKNEEITTDADELLDAWLGIGHGGKDTGAVANDIIERDINLIVGLKAKYHLERHNVKVGIDRTDNTTPRPTKPTNVRVLDAKNNPAKIAIDIHHNSMGGEGTAEGYQIIHYGEGPSKDFAYILAGEFDKLGQPKNKIFTKERADGRPYYYWIREIPYPSVISEFAFIDNKSDADKLKAESWLEKEAIAIAKAVLIFLGKEWIEEKTLNPGLRWLQQEANLDDTITSKDVVDYESLGLILKKLYNKGEDKQWNK